MRCPLQSLACASSYYTLPAGLSGGQPRHLDSLRRALEHECFHIRSVHWEWGSKREATCVSVVSQRPSAPGTVHSVQGGNSAGLTRQTRCLTALRLLSFDTFWHVPHSEESLRGRAPPSRKPTDTFQSGSHQLSLSDAFKQKPLSG